MKNGEVGGASPSPLMIAIFSMAGAITGQPSKMVKHGRSSSRVITYRLD